MLDGDDSVVSDESDDNELSDDNISVLSEDDELDDDVDSDVDSDDNELGDDNISVLSEDDELDNDVDSDDELNDDSDDDEYPNTGISVIKPTDWPTSCTVQVMPSGLVTTVFPEVLMNNPSVVEYSVLYS